jgi:hypothetical protein
MSRKGGERWGTRAMDKIVCRRGPPATDGWPTFALGQRWGPGSSVMTFLCLFLVLHSRYGFKVWVERNRMENCAICMAPRCSVACHRA